MYIGKCFFCLIAFALSNAYAQQPSFIAHSNSADATAYSNSHKIVTRNGDLESDTIYVVYYSSDTIYHTYTTDRGQSWQPSAAIYAGIYPALDVDAFGFRHVAWQYFDSGSNNYEIYYDCLDDWSPPQNISQTPTNSVLPDLVIDSLGIAHIAWVEIDQIFYRTYHNGVLGDTVCLSGYGSTLANYSYPSMSIFLPNHRVYVVWECYDPQCYSPYQIHYRYKEDNSWSATNVWAHYLPMRHPSIDFSHGSEWTLEELSLCYEDSTSGNMEATFYGGNGGGLSTPGRSTYPVISTVGSTWSYLFWQEDSVGQEDIYCQLYYFFAGWTVHSLRGWFNIMEPVRYPSACGAYLVWTQGASAPYGIYFADFGYPIGIREGQQAQSSILHAKPNPFSQMIDIRYLIADKSRGPRDKRSGLKIYNSAGQLIKDFPRRPHSTGHTLSVRWDGNDYAGNEVPAGIYFCCLEGETRGFFVKIVKVD